MKIRRRILLLMVLTWPHQGYAQSRVPSTEPYTVGSWFGAMRSDFVYALQAPTRWSSRDGLMMTTLTLTLVGLVGLADEDIDREFAQDERQMLLRPVRGLLPLGEKYDTMSSKSVMIGLTSAFLISGVALDQPRHLETARLLLEAYAIVNGVGVIGKQMLAYTDLQSDRIDLTPLCNAQIGEEMLQGYPRDVVGPAQRAIDRARGAPREPLPTRETRARRTSLLED